MTIDISWVALAFGLITCLIIGVVYFRLSKKQTQLTQQLSEKLALNERELKILKHEINEVRAGSIGIGQSVKQINRVLLEIDARQGELELQDPESKLYSRAAKMAEKGASVEDIMADCEIPKIEAELIVSLRGR